MNVEPRNLEQLLDRLRAAGEGHDHVSLGALLEAAGRRSFGPLLLLVGLIPFSPLSGIPGLSSLMALCVAMISVQQLMGRRYFWLPRWLLRRRLSRARFETLLRFVQPVARGIDRFVRPRLVWMTRGPAVTALAVVTTAVALVMPLLEVVPFGNSALGAAISIFGLALITHDGALVLLGFAMCAAAAGTVILAIA